MELLAPHVYVFYLVLTSLILVLVGAFAVSKPSKVPGRLQGFFEWSIEALRGTFMGALGPGGERHLPLIYTLFFYILFCDLIELIPGFKAATANPSNTIAMGIVVFAYTQYVGIKSKGLGNYLKHFLGPLLVLAPLFFVIEILGELIKPFSLGMRLFGNIYAEDVMNDLAAKALYIPALHIYVPFQFFVYFLQIFTGVIQAFIFALLTCAYIGIMSEHHDDHGDEYDPNPHQESPEEHAALTMGSIAARTITPH